MNTTGIIENISIIIAAWAVIIGINAWRRAYIGQRNIELAEDVLAMFYEVKDIMANIRSPFGYTGEGSTRTAAANETEEEKKIYARAFVTYERYNKHSEFFSKIFSLRYRYMARFGKDSVKPFDDLHNIISEILSAATMLSYYWTERGSKSESSDEERRKQEALIWYRGSKDEVVPKIEKMILDIEEQSRKILNPPLGSKIKQWFI